LLDLALTLFSSLGGHVEPPDGEVFINPLGGYVEDKACESLADAREMLRSASGYRA
jgi:hypothetical protein